MRIAYYDIGNLRKDEQYGLGRIYDEKGDLILGDGEKILVKGVCISSLDRKMRGKEIFWMGWGIGTLFLTNKRIVHIRTPSISSTSGLGGIPGSVMYGVESLMLKMKGMKEVIEASSKEILGYTEKSYGADVFLAHDGSECILAVVVEWTKDLLRLYRRWPVFRALKKLPSVERLPVSEFSQFLSGLEKK